MIIKTISPEDALKAMVSGKNVECRLIAGGEFDNIAQFSANVFIKEGFELLGTAIYSDR